MIIAQCYFQLSPGGNPPPQNPKFLPEKHPKYKKKLKNASNLPPRYVFSPPRICSLELTLIKAYRNYPQPLLPQSNYFWNVVISYFSLKKMLTIFLQYNECSLRDDKKNQEKWKRYVYWLVYNQHSFDLIPGPAPTQFAPKQSKLK